jgi:hypothetical protein
MVAMIVVTVLRQGASKLLASINACADIECAEIKVTLICLGTAGVLLRRDVIGYNRIRYFNGRSRTVSARISGRSDWRTMIRGTDRVVIVLEMIAAGIPTIYPAISVTLLIISASVKTSHRFQWP